MHGIAQTGSLQASGVYRILSDDFTLTTNSYKLSEWEQWANAQGYGAAVSMQIPVGERLHLGWAVEYLKIEVQYPGATFFDADGNGARDLIPLRTTGSLLIPKINLYYTLLKKTKWELRLGGGLEAAIGLRGEDLIEGIAGMEHSLKIFEEEAKTLVGLNLGLVTRFYPFQKRDFHLHLSIDGQSLHYLKRKTEWQFIYGPQLGLGYDF